MSVLHSQEVITVSPGTPLVYRPAGLNNAFTHTIDVTGAGTYDVDAYHIGRTVPRSLLSGGSDQYNVWLYPGCSRIDVTAIGSDIEVTISSHTGGGS